MRKARPGFACLQNRGRLKKTQLDIFLKKSYPFKMNIYLLFALTFVPLLAVFLLFMILVPGQKIRYGLWACILGIFTVIPTALVQHFVLNLPIFSEPTVINLLVTAIVFNGLLEETFKMLFMALVPKKKLSIPAYFTCCLLAGLTLGCFESIIYLVKRLGENTYQMEINELYILLLSRTFTSVLVHTFCAGLGGLYLWLYKSKNAHILPFVWAVVLHGVYNFFAGFKTGFYWFAIIAVLFAALECRIWYKFVTSLDSSLDKN